MIHAQVSQPNSGDGSAPPAALVSIHGVVKNAATGEPLARALVSIESEPGKAALTDIDGRFEISGVPAASTVPVDLTKPGFEDASGAGGGSGIWASNHSMPHPVTVGADMPDLEFAMRPLNAIRGQIELSTGEPGEGFRVELFKQSVQDGRLLWRVVGNTPTNADGAFRFGGLSDGVYTVATQPSIDGGGGGFVDLAGKQPAVRTGYPRTFYPDVRSLSGAGQIHVSAGQAAQANFMLRQQQFHVVQAAVSGPGVGGRTGLPGAVISTSGSATTIMSSGFDPEVLDARQHESAYRAEYDQRANLMQALLPDGDYILRVSAFGPSKPFLNSSGGIVTEDKNFLAGQTEISINGHAITNLRIALGPESSNALNVLVNRTGTQVPQQQNATGLFVTATLAGPDAADPMSTQFAQGSVPATLETQPLAPGSYWLHTSITQAGLCESSFTAGGANLAREPLLVAANGSTAPLTLTLRDDCASLRVTLPRISSSATGELPMVYVYVVPDFDSTAQVRQNVLQSVYAKSVVIDHLAPGDYHVYTLSTPADLPYRDPDAMAALNLQGQAVTLSPGASADLLLEVPAP